MPQYQAGEIGVHVVYPSRKHLPLKVRRMVEFLVEEFSVPPWTQPAA